MVARPLLRPPREDVRNQAARVAALALDRRRLASWRGPGHEGDATVHPMGPLADDPEAAAVAAALAHPPRLGRRLLLPATLPPGLDPDLDRALAALAPDARLAVTLRCWLGWEVHRIADLLARSVPEAQTLLAEAVDSVDREQEAVGRHLGVRAQELRSRPTPVVPGRAVGAALAVVVVVALVMFAGAASAPLPTVGVPPELDLTLSLVGDEPAPEAAFPPTDEVAHREAGAGEALAWTAGEVPPGVAFRWVHAVEGGFVAIGVDPAAATDPLVRPAGFWSSSDGLAWQPLRADAAAFGPEDVVGGFAAGPAGLVAVGGARHGPDTVVRPMAWRLAPGAAAWGRAGLRTPPLGGPASIRQVYRHLSVVAAGSEFFAHARGAFAPTGRSLPAGFEYDFDELGVTLRGPAGAALERLHFDDIGLTSSAAARLVTDEVGHAAWRSADGRRWEPLAIEAPRRLGAPVDAAGRLWSAAGGTLASSPDGRRWAPVDLGVELVATAVAGHPGGLVVATGDRTLVGADAAEWFTVGLPSAGNVFTGARWVAGGPAGVVAYGTMGSDAGTVLVPQVTVPGRDAVMELDLFTGQLDVVEPDGAVRHTGRYYEGGTFRADFGGGTFQVVDGFGNVHMIGRLDDWAAAVAAAERTPFPPQGPIAVWYSTDGVGWRLQELDARGFPSSVAVGEERIVVAAIQPRRVGRAATPQVWVGATP